MKRGFPMWRSVLVALLVLIPMSYADAQIPSIEREALIALYNSTDGANWSDNTNWLGEVGTECTWYGVTCSGGHVAWLHLSSNQLRGVIPPELGNLSSLWELYLYNNRLNGSIPPSLGDLPSLGYLLLHSNELSGRIPPSLGNLSSLLGLYMHSNQLSGVIPPELGNLLSLEWLSLSSNHLSGVIPLELGNLPTLWGLGLSANQLSGVIPPELGNLSSLFDGVGLDLRWNGLHSDNPPLIAFLNSKQDGGDWQSTQTVAPENPVVAPVGDHTVWLSWDVVSYQSDPGGYEVFSAPAGSGNWTSGGWTEAKTVTTFPVTGLDPAKTYDLVVVTYTDPHFYNLNLVISDLSIVETAATGSVGCAQPIIKISWDDPVSLSVVGFYDTYLWSTGETTPSIDISPVVERWYWATVTSAGPCEETAAFLIDLEKIFADGFETGNTSVWSTWMPDP